MLQQLIQSILILRWNLSSLSILNPGHPQKVRALQHWQKLPAILKKKNLLVDLKFSSAEPTGGLFHNKLIFTDLQVFISSYYCTWHLQDSAIHNAYRSCNNQKLIVELPRKTSNHQAKSDKQYRPDKNHRILPYTLPIKHSHFSLPSCDLLNTGDNSVPSWNSHLFFFTSVLLLNNLAFSKETFYS